MRIREKDDVLARSVEAVPTSPVQTIVIQSADAGVRLAAQRGSSNQDRAKFASLVVRDGQELARGILGSVKLKNRPRGR